MCFNAMVETTGGFWNTASGSGALQGDTTGNSDTPVGDGALAANINGNK